MHETSEIAIGAQIQKEIRRSEMGEKERDARPRKMQPFSRSHWDKCIIQHDKKACCQKRTFAHFWEIPDAKYQGGLIPESSIIWTNSEINGREFFSRRRKTCTPTS
ncbi:hypothetical protein C8R44DRAFT_749235 [Mycena epipterygia]|nr:hypothetical protein C8R44DRAFT_749235 [Mycena epipterygia]